MRFAWLVSAVVMLLVGACSGGNSSPSADSSLSPLAIKGALRVTGGYCDLFAKETQATFNPSHSGSSAEVYEVKPVAVDEQYAANVARKLGLSVTPHHESHYRVLRYVFGPDSTGITTVPAFIAEDSKASLAVEERTGRIHYALKKPGSAASADSGAISNDQAVDIAKRFLGGLDLLPDEDAKMTVWGGSYVQWELSGVDVMQDYTPVGIYVTINEDGAVSFLVYAWQGLHSLGKYPLASEAEALERLRTCDGYITSSSRGAPTVGEVRLEYLGLPAEGSYDYFVPVYHFGNELALEGTPRPQNLKDPELMTDAWVLAVADHYIEAPPSE